MQGNPRFQDATISVASDTFGYFVLCPSPLSTNVCIFRLSNLSLHLKRRIGATRLTPPKFFFFGAPKHLYKQYKLCISIFSFQLTQQARDILFLPYMQ